MVAHTIQVCYLVFFIQVLINVVHSEDVPDPVALFPLNSLHTTEDISNSYLTAGTAVGVSLASGPDGKSRGSYYFQGSASSYIEIPQQTKLDTRYSTTILAWVYNEGTTGPIVLYETESANFALHMFTISPSSLFFRIANRNDLTNDNNNPIVYDMGTVNKWRYVGATYEYSTGYQRLFVDGVKVKEELLAKQEIATNYKIKLGGVKVGDSRIFKGRISCLQIYDKALTQSQVQAVKDNCVEKNKFTACLFHVYNVMNDPTRAIDYKVSGQSPDRQAFKRRRWYRLKSKVPTRIATSCPAAGSCGSQSPGWLNGQYPSLETGIEKMEICYRTGSNCCGRKAIIYVRQCYGYPVFMLDDVPDISLGNRICTETGPENTFPNILFQSSEKCLSYHFMYAEKNVIDASTCINYCMNAGEKCKSINYYKSKNGTCQLKDATITHYPKHSFRNSDCTYYERKAVMFYTIT